MINPGTHYKVFQDILKYVHDQGNATGPLDEMANQQMYRVGVLMGVMTVESIAKATEKFGNKPMSVKFQRWNGTAFEPASDWISTDQGMVRPMIEASASKYADEKGLSAACN